jgi:alpha-glucosidase
MFWDQDDGNLSEIEDSFFFGDHLLVAPVLEEGQKERDVYFPEGAWIDFYDGSVYEGDREYIVKIQIDKIPVFVRSGAVIPVKENGSRILRLYAAEGTRGSTTSYIYSDSGDGYGASMVEEITVEQNEGHININRMAKGEFVLLEETELKLFGGTIEKITVNDKMLGPAEKVLIRSDFSNIRIQIK